jgi:PAS domain S-box-containing protein
MHKWRKMSLADRIQWLQWRVPLTLIIIVILYQLGPARIVDEELGHLMHYSIEIAFYSLVGPAATWVTLAWIGRWLAEKEAVEQQARERERYLASITEASADAIVSLDNDWRIRSWNRGAESIFGYAAGEILDEPFRALLADKGDADGEIACLSAGLDQRGFVRDYELTCRTKSGQRVVVELTQTQLMDDAGKVSGTSAILRDITQRKEREEIVNEERGRIARDLHDGLAQNLYFLALKTDLCRKLLDQEPARVHQELRTIKQSLQDSIEDVRSTIFALRPMDLRRLGFWRGTQQFITAFGEQHTLKIDWRVSGNKEDLPSSLEPTLFRLIQESLNNVGKHAGARHVWIDLVLGHSDRVGLTIRDDGQGFVVERGNGANSLSDGSMSPGRVSGDGLAFPDGRRSGLGLIQMRERVGALGGTFEVESQVGRGTTVSAWLPVPEQSEGARS